LSQLIQDLRLALRLLRRNPVWSATIVVVLALGIGGNMAMLSAFDAWVVRPLDLERPEELVALHETQPELDRRGFGVAARTLGDWRAAQTTFVAIEPFTRRQFTVTGAEDPERIQGAAISAGLLPLLGRHPVLGRAFTAEEDLAGQPARSALVSTSLWTNRFAADPQILGRTLLLDDEPHEIVGVMEEGFAFPEWADVWVPLAVDEQAGPREQRRLSLVGRLRPGVERAHAEQEIRSIAADIARREPDSNAGWSAEVTPLREEWAPPVIRVALTASAGAALLVLAVICANVANLFLARALARNQETALRSVLGASRWRLMRQALTEATVLALIAAAVGTPLGIAMTRWMISWAPVDPPYLFAFRIDHRAMLYTLAVSLIAGVASGLGPVVRTTGASLFEALKSGSRSSQTRSTSRFRGLLIGAELALSTALLVGALLMVKSFVQQQRHDLGYQTSDVFTAQVSITGKAYAEPERRGAFLERATLAVSEIPAVAAVAWVDRLPASQGFETVGLEAEGIFRERGEEPNAVLQRVHGEYFETLGIAVETGRAPTAAETRDGAAVVVVSEALARQLWQTQDAVGRRLRPLEAEGPWLRVIGVAADISHGVGMVQFGSPPAGRIYLPYGSNPVDEMALVVRSADTGAVFAEAVRSALRRADPGVPVTDTRSLATAVDDVHWVDRYFSQLLSLYALVALAIAAVGVYGVAAESVARRRGEMAVRQALGASRADLLRLIVGRGLRLGGLGVLVGLTLAGISTRYGAAMLQDVSATDPGVFLGVGLLLLLVVTAANWLPASRAARIDPVKALRAE
jgi:predicted permease